MQARDAVAEGDHGPDFVDAHLRVVVGNLLLEERGYFVCFNLRHAFRFPGLFVMSRSVLILPGSAALYRRLSCASSSLSRSSRPRTEPSYTVLPTCTTAPPSRELSSSNCASTVPPVSAAICCLQFAALLLVQLPCGGHFRFGNPQPLVDFAPELRDHVVKARDAIVPDEHGDEVPRLLGHFRASRSACRATQPLLHRERRVEEKLAQFGGSHATLRQNRRAAAARLSRSASSRKSHRRRRARIGMHSSPFMPPLRNPCSEPCRIPGPGRGRCRWKAAILRMALSMARSAANFFRSRWAAACTAPRFPARRRRRYAPARLREPRECASRRSTAFLLHLLADRIDFRIEPEKPGFYFGQPAVGIVGGQSRLDQLLLQRFRPLAEHLRNHLPQEDGDGEDQNAGVEVLENLRGRFGLHMGDARDGIHGAECRYCSMSELVSGSSMCSPPPAEGFRCCCEDGESAGGLGMQHAPPVRTAGPRKAPRSGIE